MELCEICFKQKCENIYISIYEKCGSIDGCFTSVLQGIKLQKQGSPVLCYWTGLAGLATLRYRAVDGAFWNVDIVFFSKSFAKEMPIA